MERIKDGFYLTNKVNKTKLQGHLLIGTVSFLFGINMVISKSILPDKISPEGLTLSRILFACIAFWVTSIFLPKEKPEKKDMWMLFVCSLTGIVLNQGAFIKGLSSTSPVDASVLTTCSPMFVIVLAFFFLKEPITLKKAGGVLIGAAGAILLVLSGNHAGGSVSSVSGNLLIVLGGFMYAIYLTIAKPLTLKYTSVTIMKWMFLFSTLILLPFEYKSLLEAPAYQSPYESQTIWSLIFILFGATYITYLMIPLALKRIRPTTVSMYNYVQPIIASLAATILGQDVITWQKIGCAIMIFVGVYLVTISKSRADMENPVK